MPRIDHVAVETDDPDATAAFYKRLLGARIVKKEGHPVMGYLGTTAFAFHEQGGPRPHTAIRVSEEERAQIKRRLDAQGIESEERDHEIAVGLFFRDRRTADRGDHLSRRRRSAAPAVSRSSVSPSPFHWSASRTGGYAAGVA